MKIISPPFNRGIVDKELEKIPPDLLMLRAVYVLHDIMKGPAKTNAFFYFGDGIIKFEREGDNPSIFYI